MDDFRLSSSLGVKQSSVNLVLAQVLEPSMKLGNLLDNFGILESRKFSTEHNLYVRINACSF